MSAADVSTTDVDCANLGAFMTRLATLRRADDLIVVSLNNELPTRSFPDCKKSKQICERFRSQLESVAHARESLIRRCNSEIQERMAALGDSSAEMRPLRSVLRQIRSEADVEQIVIERSRKAVHERCDRI